MDETEGPLPRFVEVGSSGELSGPGVVFIGRLPAGVVLAQAAQQPDAGVPHGDEAEVGHLVGEAGQGGPGVGVGFLHLVSSQIGVRVYVEKSGLGFGL